MRHEAVLPEAEGCDDGCLGDVLLLHEVDAGEELAAVQLGRKVEDGGQRVLIWFGGQVEAVVIAAEAPGSDFFRHHVQGRQPR